jgi:hypothetical protein
MISLLSKGQQEFIVDSGARRFLSEDGKIDKSRGFTSKDYASLWIESLGREVDWRAGFIFRLRGCSNDLEIVSSKRVRARTR